jgi:uncharacterized RDD family membrane protein YckC
MSTPPPEDSAPVPPGYQPGEYVPFNDRDPSNPSSIAGQWADPARAAQEGGLKLTAEEQYRAIYGYDAPTRVVYASWGRRVLGYLVDAFFSTVVSIPLIIGYVMLVRGLELRTDPVTGQTVTGPGSEVSDTTVVFLVIGSALVIAFFLWNSVVRQGRTGYTLGKTVVGIRLVKHATGEPLGAGLCFVRQLAHYVDSLVCYLGWFWPLWDAKRQTLADKIMSSVVVVQRQEEVGS